MTDVKQLVSSLWGLAEQAYGDVASVEIRSDRNGVFVCVNGMCWYEAEHAADVMRRRIESNVRAV